MIPRYITTTHIEEAVRLILRDGVPRGRRSRGYCLVTKGRHLPPKYTIALAHQAATGQFLDSDRFSGGQESNEFLRHRGFAVVECTCRGTVRDDSDTLVSPPLKRKRRAVAAGRHNERCRTCKTRVGQLLERIYGACVRDHRFGWQTGLEAYARTPIAPTLRDVAVVLERHRGYGIDRFVRTTLLAPCDYWIPGPGFIVEFDESQHFTRPRKLALSAYADTHTLGFSARRWMELCDRHDAKDNDPPFRDEQRAWYDTLRDLAAPTQGFQPTVRLYARDLVWCSLDPDSPEDRERFADLIHDGSSRARRTAVRIPTPPEPSDSTVRVAMVFPPAAQKSSNGVPPSGPGRPAAGRAHRRFLRGRGRRLRALPRRLRIGVRSRTLRIALEARRGTGRPAARGRDRHDRRLHRPRLAGSPSVRSRRVSLPGVRETLDGRRRGVRAAGLGGDGGASDVPVGRRQGGSNDLSRPLPGTPSPLPRAKRRTHLGQSELRQRDRHQVVVDSAVACGGESFLCAVHAPLRRGQEENPPLRVRSRWHRTLGQAGGLGSQAASLGVLGGGQHLRDRPRHGRGRQAGRLVEDPVRRQAQSPAERDAC